MENFIINFLVIFVIVLYVLIKIFIYFTIIRPLRKEYKEIAEIEIVPVTRKQILMYAEMYGIDVKKGEHTETVRKKIIKIWSGVAARTKEECRRHM